MHNNLRFKAWIILNISNRLIETQLSPFKSPTFVEGGKVSIGPVRSAHATSSESGPWPQKTLSEQRRANLSVCNDMCSIGWTWLWAMTSLVQIEFGVLNYSLWHMFLLIHEIWVVFWKNIWAEIRGGLRMRERYNVTRMKHFTDAVFICFYLEGTQHIQFISIRFLDHFDEDLHDKV